MIWWYYCQSGETKSGIGLIRPAQIQAWVYIASSPGSSPLSEKEPGFQVEKLFRGIILCGSHSGFPVPGGTVGMVQGHYAYYHYMQDKFNDDVSAAPIHGVINMSLITL